MYARVPSLEISWLPLSERKTMPTPQVAFADEPGVGGYYLMRGLRDDAFQHAGMRDVLVLSTHYGGDYRASTIAHEYRHMQQRYLPSLPRIGWSDAIDFGTTWAEWCAAIKRFYRRPWELDALRFELRLSPDDTNIMAREALR